MRRFIHHPVHLARLKPAVQRDVRRVRHPPAIHHAGESPPLPGNHRLRTILVILHRQHRVPALQVVRRIGPVLPVRQKLRVDIRQRLERHYNPTRHRRPVIVLRVRHVAPEQTLRVGHVVLPAAPYQAVAAAHQEPIARVRVSVRRSVGRAVDVLQCQFLAPVHHVQQQTPVAVVIVHRLEDAKVRRKLHQPVAIARRLHDVGNHPVVRMCRVNGKVRHPVNLLIPSHVAESLPTGKGLPSPYVQPSKRHLNSPHKISLVSTSKSPGASAPVLSRHHCPKASSPMASRSRARCAFTCTSIGNSYWTTN